MESLPTPIGTSTLALLFKQLQCKNIRSLAEQLRGMHHRRKLRSADPVELWLPTPATKIGWSIFFIFAAAKRCVWMIYFTIATSCLMALSKLLDLGLHTPSHVMTFGSTCTLASLTFPMASYFGSRNCRPVWKMNAFQAFWLPYLPVK